MAAPIAKGLIITASVLVAAGIAFYENEQVREWILQSRQRIAMALHSLGDEINPPSHHFDDDEAGADARRRRRQEVIRQNRLQLIRRAREEGIAVDLDELTALGDRESASLSRGFDDLVGTDGTLRSVSPRPEMSQTTGAESTIGEVVRRRGADARGIDVGMSWANPFDDEAQIVLDGQLIGTEEEEQELLLRSRESTRTLSPAPLIDTSDSQSEYFSEAELEAQIEEAIRRSLTDVSAAASIAEESPFSDPPTSIPAADDASMTDSTDDLYYYAPPPNVSQPPASHQAMFSSAMEAMLEANLHNASDPRADNGFEEDHESHTPSGTLTPTDDGFSATASYAGSGAGDAASMSDFHSVADNRSVMGEVPPPLFGNASVNEEAMSDAGYSTDTFSLVGPGASTPGSWSDVGSEAGEEEGFQGQMEHQQHPQGSSDTIAQ